MSAAAQQPSRPKMDVTSLEAALLVLAAFFLSAVVTRDSHYTFPPYSLVPWLAGQVVPPLVLLIGSVWATTRYAGLVHWNLHGWRPAIACLGSFFLGFAGGASWFGTSPRLIAPILSEPGQIAWAVVWVGILAPIIEEFYFRGVLQSTLHLRLGSGGSVVVAALVFALAHVGAPGFFILWIFLGLIFGMLWQHSRYLPVPVCAHIGWNLGTIGKTILPLAEGKVWFWVACCSLFCYLCGVLPWSSKSDAK